MLICAFIHEKAPFPWAASGVAAMAMTTEDRLLLLTGEATLFTLPMASAVASPHTFSALRPMSLRVRTTPRTWGQFASPWISPCAAAPMLPQGPTS